MKSLTTLLLIILSAGFAYASEGGHAATGHHFPWDRFVYQCINVSILVIAIVYFTKNSIKDYFTARRAQFVQSANKAQATRLAAEQENKDIKVRLSKLETTAEESILRARAEAAQMKQSIIAEAEATAKRLASEAEAAARFEIEKAKQTLRTQLLKESLSSARSALAKVSNDEQQRLQENFIDNIQAVQR